MIKDNPFLLEIFITMKLENSKSDITIWAKRMEWYAKITSEGDCLK